MPEEIKQAKDALDAALEHFVKVLISTDKANILAYAMMNHVAAALEDAYMQDDDVDVAGVKWFNPLIAAWQELDPELIKKGMN